MKRLPFLLCILVLLFSETYAWAQTTRKALFLGNSYTGVNGLPQLVKDAALSAGDTLIFDSNTPGGYRLSDHFQSASSMGKIKGGDWDYVVLQGQSREPILQTSSFKHAGRQLNDTITLYNPCGVTMLYMTWGRKNGDQAFCAAYPQMCTYVGMDSSLRDEYLDLANSINGEVSPVSAVWRHLRQNNPNIDLYQVDESHPSAAGSYAAACSFYAAIFKKDPTLITWNYSLSASDAAAIRNAAKTVVYNSLNTWDYKKLPRSKFSYITDSGNNEVSFSPIRNGVLQTYFWDFGDGNTSNLGIPSHTYASNGTYTVTLTTTNCDLQGMHSSVSDTVIQFCSHTPSISISSTSLCHYDTLWTQPADSYQWYAGGLPIPETGQYLANYKRYNSLAFSVSSTVNGCSELSQLYYANPQWSGYYFDAAWGGDPCQGDTALFIAKHINVTLPDSGLILWYKNGTLLPSFTNQDTLLITTQGIYECKAVDTTSYCPFDTTSSGTVVFDCGSLSMQKQKPELIISLYPNPAAEVVILELAPDVGRDEILIYNTSGCLLKSIKTKSNMAIDVSDLAPGLYFIGLRNKEQLMLKFLKE